MRYAVYIPNFGPFYSPSTVAELAVAAEEAGWDGLFMWDHLLWNDEPVGDPWIALAAAAVATSRLELGPVAVPLARRRPWQVARQAVSLDHLSNGRAVLGIGLGSDDHGDFSRFGEEVDLRRRAAMADDGLQLIDQLWSGSSVTQAGPAYGVNDVVLTPQPVRVPRIPIWIAGTWPHRAPFRRAARWDGAVPQHHERELEPREVADVSAFIRGVRGESTPFDLLYIGVSPDNGPQARKSAALIEESGATWWLENAGVGWLGRRRELASLGAITDRVKQGPPRP